MATKNPSSQKANPAKTTSQKGKNSEGFFSVLGMPQFAVLLAILSLTAFVFYPMLSNRFTDWDDKDYVTENALIVKMDATKVKEIFSKPVAYNYHPLTIVSL